MIKIHRNTYCHTFEYLYLFVMVIYMAQMTHDTGRMVGTLSGNPIPFLIPIVLTIFLLFRHRTSFFYSKLWLFVGIMLIWSVAVCLKFHDFSSSNLSYYFFLIYAIIIAFIHVRIFGRDLFSIYEHIIVVLSGISLLLWGATVLSPAMRSFFLQFPETSYGNNFLYIFNCMDPTKDQVYRSIIRNAGCSWEPGRFAIMLTLAIFVNLSRNGVRFNHNKKIIILLLALATTFSTTGYVITILLYFIFWFEKINLKSVLTFFLIALPLSIYIFSIDFMAGKIQDTVSYEGLTKERMHNINYNEGQSGEEYLGSLDRFESASFDWMNFLHEPLLGYGKNWDYSWFRQNISTNIALTGGLVKILAQYGIIVALLLYSLLFYSSVKISRLFNHRHKLAFAIMILLSSISYNIFCIPIFTAFWFYGLFYREAIRQSVPVKKKIPVYIDSPLFYRKINRVIQHQERKVVAGDLLTKKETIREIPATPKHKIAAFTKVKHAISILRKGLATIPLAVIAFFGRISHMFVHALSILWKRLVAILIAVMAFFGRITNKLLHALSMLWKGLVAIPIAVIAFLGRITNKLIHALSMLWKGLVTIPIAVMAFLRRIIHKLVHALSVLWKQLVAIPLAVTAFFGRMAHNILHALSMFWKGLVAIPLAVRAFFGRIVRKLVDTFSLIWKRIVIIMLSAMGIGAGGYVAYNLIMPLNEPEVVTNQEMAQSTKSIAAEAAEELSWDVYDSMDVRLQAGDYYIVALDHTITANAGDNASTIASRVFGGEGWSCYIEVYNGIDASTELEEGREVKIPKLVKKSTWEKQLRKSVKRSL